MSFNAGKHEPTGTSVPVGAFTSALAYDAGSIWVLCPGQDASIMQLDPSDRTVMATIPLGFDAVDIVFAGGALWAVNLGLGRLVKVDAVANRVTSESVCVGLDVHGLDVNELGVWAGDGISGAIALMPLH